MKLRDLYAYHFANFISGGKLVSRDKISSLGLKPAYDRFFTSRYITKIWLITGFPVDFSSNLTDAIRLELFKEFPKVKTKINFRGFPNDVNIKSEIFKSAMANADQTYEEYQKAFDSLSKSGQKSGYSERVAGGGRIKINKAQLEMFRQEKDSYFYVNDVTESGDVFTNGLYFIQASANTDKEMISYAHSLESLLGSAGIQTREIRGKINNYLENYCPASGTKSNKFNTVLLSPENIASIMPYRSIGLLSNKGMLIGMDWRSKLPYFHDIYSSASAQVAIVVGKAGSGKTFITENIAIGHLGENSHGSMFDIKGGEGKKLLEYVDGIEIGMGDPDSPYFNALRFSDMIGYGLSSVEVFNFAVRTVCDIFAIMTNLLPKEGNPADLEIILSSAVLKTLNNAGVFADKEQSFVFTDNLTYEMVLNSVRVQKNSPSNTPEMQKMSELVISRCSQYVDRNGEYAEGFKKEITLKEIIDIPFIIYNFNKSKSDKMTILDSVKQYMASALDTKKANIRNSRGLHTFVIYEELQRCLGMKIMIDHISSRITMSRSEGLFIYLLFNVISILENGALDSLRSNITTKFIGNIEESDVALLIDKYGCAGIKDEIELITKDEDGTWKHCFAMHSDTGRSTVKSIIKAVVPDSMERTLRTRHYREDDLNIEENNNNYSS